MSIGAFIFQAAKSFQQHDVPKISALHRRTVGGPSREGGEGERDASREVLHHNLSVALENGYFALVMEPSLFYFLF